MYEPDGSELLVTIRDSRGAHKLSVDTEDYARLMNDGVTILNEVEIVRPVEEETINVDNHD